MNTRLITDSYNKQLIKIYRDSFYLRYRYLGVNDESTQRAYDRWKSEIIRIMREGTKRWPAMSWLKRKVQSFFLASMDIVTMLVDIGSIKYTI